MRFTGRRASTAKASGLRAPWRAGPVEEIIFRSPDGSIELVLIADPEHPSPPSPTRAITGFDTSDLDACEETAGRRRNRRGTGEVGGVRRQSDADRVLFADPEGFVLEIMER